MDRRHFSATLLAALAAGASTPCQCRPRQALGCSLALGAGVSDYPDLLESCGVPALDRACHEEVQRLNAWFGVAPKFGFFDDAAAPNAYAVTVGENDLGTVFFGSSLVRSIAGPSANDTLPVVAVMAHEWGHILQYDQKVSQDWGVRLELNADHLAGWYLAKTRATDPQLLSNISSLFAKLGDTSFTNADHHGTPKQRASVMLSGAGSFRLSDGRVPDSDRQLKLADTAIQALGKGFGGLR